MKCEYCGRKGKIVQDKKYCEKCEQAMVQECIRCHKPFHSVHYFTSDENHLRCNSCHTKYMKEKIRNKAKSSKLMKARSSESDVTSSEESEEEKATSATSPVIESENENQPKNKKRRITPASEEEGLRKEDEKDNKKGKKKNVSSASREKKVPVKRAAVKKTVLKSDALKSDTLKTAGANVHYFKLPEGYVPVYTNINALE